MAAPFASEVVGRGKYLRAPAVRRTSRFGPMQVGVEVTNLRDIERLPDELSLAYIRMLLRLQEDLEAACRAETPRRTGKLQSQVRAHRFGNRIVVGTSGSEFAAALNHGFTSVAKGKALRGFRVEGQDKLVYAKRVRVEGRHFFEKWLALSPAIIDEVYTRSFYDVKRGGA